MKLDFRLIENNYISFVAEDVSSGVLNPIRRILIAELPKMAIEDVEFHLGPIRDETGKEYESVSPLFDEIIGHRLGLMPIPTDLKLFGYRDRCVCKGEGCPNCTIMYTLNKKGPTTVYSRDLEPLGDSKFAIKDQDIPIVKLGEGQAILIYATAILGSGSEHAKWQPVSGVTIRFYPVIKIDYDICDNGGGCINVCPRNIMKRENEKVVVGDNFEDCILCNACVEICVPRKGGNTEGKKAIEVNYDDTRLICSFETDDSMTALDALKESIAIFRGKLNSFNEDLETVLAGPLWKEIEEKRDQEEEAAEEARLRAKEEEERAAITDEEEAKAPPVVDEGPVEDFSKIPEGDIGIFSDSVEGPSDEPAEEPSGEPAEEPEETPSEEPVEEPAEEPAEEPEETPSEEPVEEPADDSTEEPETEPETEDETSSDETN